MFLVGVITLALHLANEHPDQPETASDDGHEAVHDEVPESVTAHNFSL